jgi:hypothetical protein
MCASQPVSLARACQPQCGLCDSPSRDEVGMKKKAVLLCDIIVFCAVIVWSRVGPWDRLLGFTVYHSRGDVWLPMPPAAAAFFRSIVSTASLLFGISFLILSLLMFAMGGSSGIEKREPILYRAFYGDTLELSVKYAAFLFISFISPFFCNFMARYQVAPPMRIAGGLAISLTAFIVILTITELVARIGLQRRPVLII